MIFVQKELLYDNGGDKMTKSISDYKSQGDSVSMAKIGTESFTITGLEKSTYEGQPSYFITTKENWKGERDGEPYETHKLHTTRQVIVEQLDKMKSDLDNGESFEPMKAEEQQPKKGGKAYFELVDAKGGN